MRLSVVFALIIVFAGVMTTPVAWAASNYTLTNADMVDGTFAPPVWYYEDSENTLTLEKAQTLFIQNRFHRAAQDFNAGVSKPTYWFRVLVEVAKDFDAEAIPQLYVDITDPIIDRLEVHHLVNGQLEQKFTLGSSLPFSTRLFPAPSFVIPISVHPAQTHEFWVKVNTIHSMHLPVKVVTPQAYYLDQSGTNIFYGMLVGLTLIMAFYNALMGWRVQNIGYLFYVGVLLSGIVHRLHSSGIGVQYVWPDFPEINAYLRPLMDNTISLFSLLFTQHFLMTKVHAPKLHRFLSMLVGVVAVAAVSVFFIPDKYSLYIALWLLLVAFLVQYAVGIDAWMNKMEHAELFLLGWFVFLGGGIILVFASMGALPLNSITIHAAEIGLAIQVLALSVALSDRIRFFQQEKMEAQEKTVEHMTRYQKLYEDAMDGLFEMLPDGQVIHPNPAFCRMMGVDFNEEETLFLWELFSDAAVRQSAQNSVEKSESLVGFECQLKTRSGREIWASLFLIPSEKQDQLRFDGVVRDISESKAKDEALLAQRKAEAATTAKSAFLANMSHEIRTPLTAIIGFAEDARDQNLDPVERTSCIDTVVRSSYHLLDIINDVLDLSKIEAGKLELENIPVDFGQLLVEIQSVFAKRISAKGLDFELKIQSPVPRQIVIDPTRFKQVVLNLLGNALKFTRQGGVTLKVCYQTQDDSLILEIVDTGIGISDQQLAHIFDAFSQADVSTTRNYGGTGLGLSIVRQLLELMGGAIGVESEVDKGSRFTIVVPACSEANGEMISDIDHVQPALQNPASNWVPKLKGQVLYAEDNPVNQMLVRKLVSRTGADIEIVENGAEAIRYALEKHPDVILMDISMPVISGVTATKLLRAYGYSGVIIACTANVMAEETNRYRACGFTSCLEKPIQREAFYSELVNYCAPLEQNKNAS